MVDQIRAATHDDCHALVALNHHVQTWHAETYPERFKPSPARADITRMFEQMIAGPDSFVWLALRDDVPVGYLMANHVTRDATPISFASSRFHIEHIVVDPSARRSGVATALFAQAEHTATDLGAMELTLDTWAANTAAQAMFHASGLKTARLWLSKPL